VYVGEIIPQALCKSYALLIGNYCAGMVRVLCYAVGIISWPISKVLDYVLGDEHTVRHPLLLMSPSPAYLKRGISLLYNAHGLCCDAKYWTAAEGLSLFHNWLGLTLLSWYISYVSSGCRPFSGVPS